MSVFQSTRDRSRVEYWTERYQKQLELPNANTFNYDWYVRYEHIGDIIEMYLNSTKNDHILHLGCGNSTLQENLWKRGWSNITNVDFCEKLIKNMRRRHMSLEGMTYHISDVTYNGLLHFPDESFDIIIEKGMFDSIMSGFDNVENVKRTLAEISRILRQGGRFISISYADPLCRLPYLQNPDLNWGVESVPVPASPIHHCYICWKRNYFDEWYFGSKIYQDLAIRAKQKYHAI